MELDFRLEGGAQSWISGDGEWYMIDGCGEIDEKIKGKSFAKEILSNTVHFLGKFW
jgi:hypothetical protein